MISKGIQTSIAKKLYIFVILPGVWTPCPPSGFVQGNRAAHAFFKLIAYAQSPHLSYDVASGSDITPCNKIDKPLVVYRFMGNFMTSITTLHT